MRAVIDRIVDGKAVIIGETESELDAKSASQSEPPSEALQIIVDIAQLPQAAKVGDWVIINEHLLVQKDEYQIELDPDTTEQARLRISDKLSAIRSKSTGSKYVK